MGSVVINSAVGELASAGKLPAGFDHSWNIAPERKLAEAQAAHLELAQEAAGSSADPAAIPKPDLEFRFLQQLSHLRGACHSYSPAFPLPVLTFCAASVDAGAFFPWICAAWTCAAACLR